MATYQLNRTIEIEKDLDSVFSFFADASNLELLTPPWLRFQILTPLPVEMRQGALIDYRLRLHGIPVSWTTEISEWDPPHKFVDSQLSGPYSFWVHEHTFKATGSGTTVVGDHVRYRVPGGALVHSLFVKRDLEKIFDYRHEQLTKFCYDHATVKTDRKNQNASDL